MLTRKQYIIIFLEILKGLLCIIVYCFVKYRNTPHCPCITDTLLKIPNGNNCANVYCVNLN